MFDGMSGFVKNPKEKVEKKRFEKSCKIVSIFILWYKIKEIREMRKHVAYKIFR